MNKVPQISHVFIRFIVIIVSEATVQSNRCFEIKELTLVLNISVNNSAVKINWFYPKKV